MKRLARPRRAAVIVTLAIAASVVLSGQSSALNEASSTSFQPAADSYVSRKNPSKNFGAETLLYARTGPIMRSFLRFSISGLPEGATVVSATLRVYSPSGSQVALEAHRVGNTSWGERTVTYNNAPAFDAAVTASSGPFPAGQWLSLDVTPLVSGNGAVSLALTATTQSTISVASREDSAFAPSLLVESTVPTEIAPTNTSPPSILGSPQPAQALTAQQGAWTGTQPIDYTYQWRRCDAAGSSCADLPGADDSSYVVAGDDVGSTLRVAVTATNGAGSATAVSAPTGVVGASDPVIATAGDIACDPQSTSFNNGAGTATACRQRYTSDLMLDPTVFPDLAAVLPLGDIQYENGAYTKFLSSYDPSWGRLKAITRPVPGNHDYLTAGAAGYYQYFGSAAGDPDKGYYSYDLGAWHLIALNSNCAAVGGCGSGSSQEQWLKADLAANHATCTLAYWHHPRFSSGAEHGNDAAYDAFWRDLYASGADVILVGHEHDYERFARQSPDQAPDTRGIREFVVGIGGKSFYTFSSAQPNSEVRITQKFGVLKLTLHGSSYSWELVAEDHSVLDSGTTGCSVPAAPAVPPAPTLTSASGTDGSVSLQWSPPSSNGGAAITNYNVYRATAPGAETLLTQLGNVTSYTDTAVTNGTTYYYQVSAINSVGEGALSNERSAMPATSAVLVSDQFERTVSSGFGTADVGGPWSVSSTARTKVTGGQGVISGFTGANQDVQAWNPATATNMEVVGLVQLNASNPVGGNYQARLVARAQTDARNGYVARVTHTPAGAVTWALARVANAGGTGSITLAQGTLLSSGAAGSGWWIRLRTNGTTIQARFWRDGTAEPAAWTATATDSFWTSGRAGLGAFAASGISTPFPQVQFDDFLATTG
jgi:acid phosphatase type 7